MSSCLAGLFGKYLGFSGSTKISVFCIFLSFLIALFVFYEVNLLGCPVYFNIFNWINSEMLHINWGFMFDSLTAVMCVVVTFISFLVHFYSLEYMAHDPHLPRFMCYLSLFTFFMLILVSADNFIQMFVGWEGVGLCSYLLINFWFTRIQANKAAIKAMILNRIGDFSLVLGMLVLFCNFKSLDYASVAILVPFFKNFNVNLFNFNFNVLNCIGLFFFIGAVGKSAQIGLHTWLPDAMEGPTPVSALIHAATMVTAGVFLIARTCFLYENTIKILEIIVLIGTLTSFLASTVGLLQNDLKRVIAYSTCSQLGYMVFACGLSNYSVGVFHLSNHAFFKALLFLSAGSVIHAVNDEQDMRKMGGLKKLVPFTYIAFVVGSLALMGFPFLTGFYSKDLILETAFSKYNYLGFFSYSFGTFGAFLTAFYSTRLLFLTFLVTPNGYKKVICYAVDSGNIIKSVLLILIFPSIFIGYFSKDMFVGMGSNFFKNSLFINLNSFNLFDGEFIPLFYKLLPIHCSIFGFLIAFFLYSYKLKILFKIKSINFFKYLYVFLNKKWFFDKVYNEYLAQFFFKFGYSISYKFVDRGIFEMLGPTGLAFLTLNFGLIVHKLQTNLILHIILISFFLITVLIFFEFFKILIITTDFFFVFFNEYGQLLNYLFCLINDFCSLELLLINLFILFLIKK